MFFAPDDDDYRLQIRESKTQSSQSNRRGFCLSVLPRRYFDPGRPAIPGMDLWFVSCVCTAPAHFVFIQAADIDLTNGTGRDYFKCPLHLDTCKEDLTNYGWVLAYAFLMIGKNVGRAVKHNVFPE